MPHPLVTIGLPVFNGASWLRQCIDSLLTQTWPNFEIVISDNASTDTTETICREYAAHVGRISYHRNPRNLGVNANFTAAFRHARGKYFKWASVSDLCRPTLVEKCVEILEEREDVVLCYPRTRFIDEAGIEGELFDDRLDLQDESPSVRALRLLQNFRLANAMFGVLRSDDLRRTRLLRLYISSDINMLFEMALLGKFVEYPEPLFLRRMGKTTTTTMRGEAALADYIKPQRKRPLTWQTWRYHIAFLLDTLRAPISVAEKITIYRRLLREMVWARRTLGLEVVDAIRVWFGILR